MSNIVKFDIKQAPHTSEIAGFNRALRGVLR